MTEIEKKALALLNEVLAELAMSPHTVFHRNVNWANMALCRAIEQHEAFRQEVSDAVEAYLGHQSPWPDTSLRRFIIAKPVDPLVWLVWDAMDDQALGLSHDQAERMVAYIRENATKRGLQVTEIER